jgi:hypothetical protein
MACLIAQLVGAGTLSLGGLALQLHDLLTGPVNRSVANSLVPQGADVTSICARKRAMRSEVVIHYARSGTSGVRYVPLPEWEQLVAGIVAQQTQRELRT